MKRSKCLKHLGNFHCFFCSVTEKEYHQTGWHCQAPSTHTFFCFGGCDQRSCACFFLSFTVCLLNIAFLPTASFFKKFFAPGQARFADFRMSCTVYKYDALTKWATGAGKVTFTLYFVTKSVLSRFSLFGGIALLARRTEVPTSTYTIVPIGTSMTATELLKQNVWLLQT